MYLGSDEERVLLPKKQVPEDIEVEIRSRSFCTKDSSDRLIATTNEPELKVGELAVLEVADVGNSDISVMGTGEGSVPSVLRNRPQKWKRR